MSDDPARDSDDKLWLYGPEAQLFVDPKALLRKASQEYVIPFNADAQAATRAARRMLARETPDVPEHVVLGILWAAAKLGSVEASAMLSEQLLHEAMGETSETEYVALRRAALVWFRHAQALIGEHTVGRVDIPVGNHDTKEQARLCVDDRQVPFWQYDPGEPPIDPKKRLCELVPAARANIAKDHMRESVVMMAVGSVGHAYSVAESLLYDSVGDSDLTRAILWCAAAMGHSQSASLLAHLILADVPDLGSNRHAIIRANAATRWYWHARSLAMGSFSDREQDLKEPKAAVRHRAKLNADGEGAAKEPNEFAFEPGHHPTVVVARDIDISTGREGMEIKKRYSVLTTPLPLLGSQSTPDALKCALDSDAPWFGAANRRVASEARLMRLGGRSHAKLPPLLLVGPPAAGKSRWARHLARELGIPSRVISFAGSRDNRLLAGTARGWSSAQPSLPAIDEMCESAGDRRRALQSESIGQRLGPRNASHDVRA